MDIWVVMEVKGVIFRNVIHSFFIFVPKTSFNKTHMFQGRSMKIRIIRQKEQRYSRIAQ